jgi:ferritin-like metal-binding protein YciE
MPNSKLRTALAEQMRDMYWAERKLTEAIPKLADAAQDEDLADALRHHLEETKDQVKRLEKAFQALDLQPRAETCEAMKGLVEEGEEMLEKHDAGTMRDALIIAAAQKVEHYEIASYGTMCEWAEVLGLEEVRMLLDETLQQEKSADDKLTEVARAINRTAAEV